jgi:hypothetical protein
MISFKWQPIEGIERAACISENLYSISNQIFLVTTVRNKDFSLSKEGARVSTILWAASAGAARRATVMQIEEDDGAALMPPCEFLIAPEADTWASILDVAKYKNIFIMESASYRIATDGLFVHKQIDTKPFIYFFRSPEVEGNERPYAIQIRA